MQRKLQVIEPIRAPGQQHQTQPCLADASGKLGVRVKPHVLMMVRLLVVGARDGQLKAEQKSTDESLAHNAIQRPGEVQQILDTGPLDACSDPMKTGSFLFALYSSTATGVEQDLENIRIGQYSIFFQMVKSEGSLICVIYRQKVHELFGLATCTLCANSWKAKKKLPKLDSLYEDALMLASGISWLVIGRPPRQEIRPSTCHGFLPFSCCHPKSIVVPGKCVAFPPEDATALATQEFLLQNRPLVYGSGAIHLASVSIVVSSADADIGLTTVWQIMTGGFS